MMVSISSSLLLFISILSIFQTPAFAEKQSYIVYLGSHPNRLDNTAFDHDQAVKYHQEILGSCLGSIKKAKGAIFYSYNRYINGFAAVLSEEDVVKVKNHPKVISVFVNQGRKILTTNSWSFLGLENGNDVPLESAWNKARFGEDVIIGNLDNGVWPESKSFSDEGMGPVPAKWRGTCQTNNRDGVKCNRKLIGVRYYNRGYLHYARRYARRHNTTYVASAKMITVRDYIGHGSHTLSTAGGNIVPNVSVFGQGNGVAKGGSPKARLAAYKVCWEPLDVSACFDADIMAAIEAAISDGVDVLSLSLGGLPTEYFQSSLAIGSFHAVKNGIVVVAAAGNSGPSPGTVTNAAPWMFTVGASTTNRQFVNYITLGNKTVIKGFSLSENGLESQKFYPLITGTDARVPNATVQNASLCDGGTLDPKKVNGKILVCLRNLRATTHFGMVAARLGAVAVIVANNITLGFDVSSDAHILPASIINSVDADTLFAYINSTNTPVAHISEVKTEFNADSTMASFSSRGPNVIDSAILKPDVTAPGVDIIAAFDGELPPSRLPEDKRRLPYISLSGTSMSCPHVSGIAGLVKTVHPDWSPAAIKSAIMTTASTTYRSSRPMLDYSKTEATPFMYGSGHVNPNSALDPGLVYDLNAENYLDYLCQYGYNDTILKAFTISDKPYSCPQSFKIENFNYPSILVYNLQGPANYSRYLKNVGSPRTYNASFKAPAGVSVSIEPLSLKFEKYGEEKKFEVLFSPMANISSHDYVFGELVWSDGFHNVRSPLVVKL